jgi:hypothetical protein
MDTMSLSDAVRGTDEHARERRFEILRWLLAARELAAA